MFKHAQLLVITRFDVRCFAPTRTTEIFATRKAKMTTAAAIMASILQRQEDVMAPYQQPIMAQLNYHLRTSEDKRFK